MFRDDPTPFGCHCPWVIPTAVTKADATAFLKAMDEHGAVEVPPNSPLSGATKNHDVDCPFGGSL